MGSYTFNPGPYAVDIGSGGAGTPYSGNGGSGLVIVRYSV